VEKGAGSTQILQYLDGKTQTWKRVPATMDKKSGHAIVNTLEQIYKAVTQHFLENAFKTL